MLQAEERTRAEPGHGKAQVIFREHKMRVPCAASGGGGVVARVQGRED